MREVEHKISLFSSGSLKNAIHTSSRNPVESSQPHEDFETLKVFPILCALCIRRSDNGPWAWCLRLTLSFWKTPTSFLCILTAVSLPRSKWGTVQPSDMTHLCSAWNNEVISPYNIQTKAYSASYSRPFTMNLNETTNIASHYTLSLCQAIISITG